MCRRRRSSSRARSGQRPLGGRRRARRARARGGRHRGDRRGGRGPPRGLGHGGRRARPHALGRPAPAGGSGAGARWATPPTWSSTTSSPTWTRARKRRSCASLRQARSGDAPAGHDAPARAVAETADRSWCWTRGGWWRRAPTSELLRGRRASTRGSGAPAARGGDRQCLSDRRDEILGPRLRRPADGAAVGGDAAAPPAGPRLARAVPAHRRRRAGAALPHQGRHRRPHPRRRLGRARPGGRALSASPWWCSTRSARSRPT